jgi:glycosyltransferase involved in cell wall biosynthesis
MEAMACGVPVLTTPVGVVPSLVEHGRTGYLLSQETPVEDALSILLSWDSRQEERDRIRAAARERVVAKLDWRNAASPDLYYSLYREAQLIASRRPFRQRLHAEYRSLYQLARRR